MLRPRRLARVDLTSREVKIDDMPESLVRNFLGGRGVNMALLRRHLVPGTDAFDPGNVLVFGAGLLTGTLAPSAARWSVSSKSPEAAGLGDSSCGGFFGARLAQAGYGCLVVKGRASEPVYLLLEPEGVSIRPASELWGLGTREAQEALRAVLGGEAEIACIGPAGENLVRFACVLTGLKNAAARGGLGAVMGSKQLKAVAVRGGSGAPIASPDAFYRYCLELRGRLETTVARENFGTYGTTWLYDLWNTLGAVRTHNGQATTFTDGLNVENVQRYSEGMVACSGCSIHCRHRNRLGGEGPDYGALGALGHNCGISDPGAVIELSNLCNELGLDAVSAGGIVGWAIELYERGVIGPEIAGRELRFGDAALLRDLLVDTARRIGFGDCLAESTRAVKTFGEASRRCLIAVKGLPQSDPVDLRYITSFALGAAVSSRGADHLRSRPTADVLGMSEEFTQKVYGESVSPDPADYETKHHLIRYHEDYLAVVDSLGLCKFAYGLNGYDFCTYGDLPALMAHATGLELDEDALRAVGDRICTLERCINRAEGLGRADDTLPARYFDEPIPSGPAQGRRVDRARFQDLLSRYYRLRGWDADGDVPPRRVQELEEACRP